MYTANMNEWMKHLMAYRAKHPDKSLKQCMKEAAKTYR
jgi:hypothetical protein